MSITENSLNNSGFSQIGFSVADFRNLMLSEKRHLLFPFSKFRLFLVNPTLFTFKITTMSIIREASPLNAKDNSVF